MSNYFMLDGKKVEMSEDTAESLRAAHLDPQAIEFLKCLTETGSKQSVRYFRGKSEIYIEDTHLYVYLPSANPTWFFNVHKAAESFCAKDAYRHPIAGDSKEARLGFLVINLS